MTKGTLDRAARKARRDEVRACHEAGLSIREISERLEVLKRTVRRIVHRLDSEPPGAAALKARNAALAAYFKAGHTVSEAAATLAFPVPGRGGFSKRWSRSTCP